MTTHDATEIAYKNGYEAGKRDAVKHGRWSAEGQCPFCGNYDCRDPYGSSFCPNCGADMRQPQNMI